MPAQGTRAASWLLRLGLAAVALAILVWPLAWALDSQAKDVQLIAPFDAATVTANRAIFDPADSSDEREVIAIYGSPYGERQRILFADESKLIRPSERPALILLRKDSDDNPLQMTTVWYLARALSLGALFGGVLLLAFGRFRMRRQGAAIASGSTR